MLRKFLAISFALSLFTIFTATENLAQTRVTFAKGSSSGTVTGKLKPNENRNFILNAFEGQEIRVKVTSVDDRVKVEGEGGPTENYFDAGNGTNIIRIYNSSDSQSTFTAVFTVKDIVNAREKQVIFDKGKSSKTYKSTIGGNLIRVFVLNARKGQVISARITSKNKGVMINEEEGATLLQMEAKDGDNKIEIVNKSNVRSAYTLTFSITDKKLPPPTRINFAKGATSKTIDLVMNKYQMEKTFVIGVAKDQFIDVQVIDSEVAKRVGTRVIENRSINLHNWVDDVGFLTMEANGNGDVVFEISKNDENYLSSKLKVTIKDDPKTSTTRVKFDKGKSSKVIDLSMGVDDKSRKFVIRAMKGQTINIDIETKDAVERIAMNLNNAVDNEDDWLDGFGYLMVTTGRTGDYIFEVIKLDKKYLSAKMKVSIKSNK